MLVKILNRNKKHLNCYLNIAAYRKVLVFNRLFSLSWKLTAMLSQQNVDPQTVRATTVEHWMFTFCSEYEERRSQTVVHCDSFTRKNLNELFPYLVFAFPVFPDTSFPLPFWVICLFKTLRSGARGSFTGLPEILIFVCWTQTPMKSRVFLCLWASCSILALLPEDMKNGGSVPTVSHYDYAATTTSTISFTSSRAVNHLKYMSSENFYLKHYHHLFHFHYSDINFLGSSNNKGAKVERTLLTVCNVLLLGVRILVQ